MTQRIAVQNLSKRLGATMAVADVSFAVADGEIFGLLGLNGAGKSSVIACVVGLAVPDSGTAWIGGLDPRDRAAREQLGVALQSTGVPDKITVREAVTQFAGFYRAPLRPDDLIARFGLAEKVDARFETLSGGQKQRLALALAFVGSPRAIVLDEPTAGLDPQMRRELQSHIRAMRDEGRAVLLTTHDMEEAASLCDRIAVMDHGRILSCGTPAILIAGRAMTLEDVLMELTASAGA